MSKSVVCPECKNRIAIDAEMLGTTVACPYCSYKLKLKASGTLKPPTGASKLPPPLTPARAAPPPMGKGTTQVVRRDEMNYPEVERVGRREEREPPPRSKLPLILGLVALLLLVAAGGGGAAWWFLTQKEEDKTVKADDKDKDKDKDKPKGKADGDGKTKSGVASNSLTPDEVYNRLLRSTVWVTSQEENAGGVLVDRKDRLILTSYLVALGQPRLMVYFPDYRNKKANESQKHYRDNSARLGVPATVVRRDPTHDLALLQLEGPPPAGAPAVTLTGASPQRGAAVVAIGTADDSEGEGALWHSAKGEVLKTISDTFGLASGNRVKSRVVEFDGAAKGFGGPVADDRGRLVGLLSAGGKKGNVRTAIDAGEARVLVEGYFKTKGQAWRPDAQADVVSAKDLPRLRAELAGTDEPKRLEAVKAMGGIGAEAQDAVPDLLGAWKSADQRLAIAIGEALEKIGPPEAAQVHLLIDALKSTRKEPKLYALNSLAQMAAAAQTHLPAVMSAAAADKDADVRKAAMGVLGKVGSAENRDVVKTLVDGLEDQSASVRETAAKGLSQFGKAVRGEAFRALVMAQGDESDTVAGVANHALSQMGEATPDDIPVFTEALASAKVKVRLYAISALTKLGTQASAALNDLIKCIKDTNPDVRVGSISAVAIHREKAADAVESLIEALKDIEPRVRAVAADALGKIGKRKGVFVALLGALIDREANVREAAYDGFQELGGPMKDDLKEVADRLADSSVLVRTVAARGIGQLAPDGKASLLKLREMALGDASLAVRLAAIESLSSYAADARDAVTPLMAKLTMERPDFKTDAGSGRSLSVGGAAKASDRVGQGMMRGTVWITVGQGNYRRAATGFVVDRSNGLIVTSYRPFGGFGYRNVFVHFPQPKGETDVESRPGHYDGDPKTRIPATMIHADPRYDLALLRIPIMPREAGAFVLAGTSAPAGTEVLTVGTDGDEAANGDGTLFRRKEGKVESPAAVRSGVAGGNRVACAMIETRDPLHRFDCGGPVVNTQGELVGMQSGYGYRDRPGILVVDVAEIASFVRTHSANAGIRARPAVGTGGRSVSTTPTPGGEGAVGLSDYRVAILLLAEKVGVADPEKVLPQLRSMLRQPDGAVVSQALTVLGTLGEKATPAILDMLQLADNPQARAKVEETMAKLGKVTVPELCKHLMKLAEVQKQEARILTIIRVMESFGKEGYLPAVRGAFDKVGGHRYYNRNATIQTAIREARLKIYPD